MIKFLIFDKILNFWQTFWIFNHILNFGKKILTQFGFFYKIVFFIKYLFFINSKKKCISENINFDKSNVEPFRFNLNLTSSLIILHPKRVRRNTETDGLKEIVFRLFIKIRNPHPFPKKKCMWINLKQSLYYLMWQLCQSLAEANLFDPLLRVSLFSLFFRFYTVLRHLYDVALYST